MLEFLNQAFFVFHTALIAFNLLGWIWRRTRGLHAIALGLTAFSWFVLGLWYGWGYCVLTDWHFEIRDRLGYVDPESSYVQLLARHWCGVTISRSLADVLAGTVFALVVIATATVWIRDWRRKRSARHPGSAQHPG